MGKTRHRELINLLVVPEQVNEASAQTVLNTRLKNMSLLGYLWADKKGMEWWSFIEESRLAEQDNASFKKKYRSSKAPCYKPFCPEVFYLCTIK